MIAAHYGHIERFVSDPLMLGWQVDSALPFDRAMIDAANATAAAIVEVPLASMAELAWIACAVIVAVACPSAVEQFGQHAAICDRQSAVG